jgi:NAD-dependent dihydropyrimidine dehydrogenase PreA subunit
MSLAITAKELAYDPINGPIEAARRRAAMFAKPVKIKPITENTKTESGRSFSYAPAFFPPGGAWFKDEKFAYEIDNLKCKKTAREICEEICEKHHITFIDLISPSRPARLVIARREAVYRIRSETLCSFPMIGRILKRDHSTAVHSYYKYIREMGLENAESE